MEKKYLLGVIIVYKICFNTRDEKQKERAKTMKIKTKEMYLLAKITVFFRHKLSQKEGFIFFVYNKAALHLAMKQGTITMPHKMNNANNVCDVTTQRPQQ